MFKPFKRDIDSIAVLTHEPATDGAGEVARSSLRGKERRVAVPDILRSQVCVCWELWAMAIERKIGRRPQSRSAPIWSGTFPSFR